MITRRITRDFTLARAALLTALIALGCWVTVQCDASGLRAGNADETLVPVPARHDARDRETAKGVARDGVLL